MKVHRWRTLQAGIPVKTSFRDLGAHASTGRAKRGDTLTNRLIEGTRTTKRIRRLPIGRKDKARIKLLVDDIMLAMALLLWSL